MQKIADKHQGEEKSFGEEWWRLPLNLFTTAKINELFEELWELFASGEPWKVADQAIDTLDSWPGDTAWRYFPIMIRGFDQC